MHDMSLSDENLIIDCPSLSDAAPVVVGGVGGSGTRVIAQLWRFDAPAISTMCSYGPSRRGRRRVPLQVAEDVGLSATDWAA